MEKQTLKKDFTASNGTAGFAIGFFFANIVGFISLFFLGMILMLSNLEIGADGTVDTTQLTGIILKASQNKSFAFSLMAMNQIVFISCYFGLARFKGIAPFKAGGIDKKPTLKEMGLVVAISLIAVYFLSGAASVFDMGLDAIGYTKVGLGIEFNGAGDFIAAFIVICILAPIGEELIFRGLLARSIEREFGEKPAILLSSLAFMIMHVNPEQTVYQFMLGVVLGLIVVRTGKLWPAILLHALNNFWALLFEYVPQLTSWYDSVVGVAGDAVAILILLSFTAVAAVAIWRLVKLMPKKQEQIMPLRVSKNFFLEFYAMIGACGFLWAIQFITQMVIPAV